MEHLASSHPVAMTEILAPGEEIARYEGLRGAETGYDSRMTDAPSASMRMLALRLLTVEAASKSAAGSHVHEGVRVCEKLQKSVTQFAGSDGFASLLRRALALARAQNPSLQTVKLQPDGSLDNCKALAIAGANGEPEGAVAIIAHLLGLLETFVGEPFTLRLVRQAWPDASLDI
jgi:hypothetical protein